MKHHNQDMEWLLALPRAVGHTRKLLESGAIVVMATSRGVKEARKDPGYKANARTLISAREGGLHGVHEPVCIDNAAVLTMLQDAYEDGIAQRYAEIIALKAKVKDAQSLIFLLKGSEQKARQKVSALAYELRRQVHLNATLTEKVEAAEGLFRVLAACVADGGDLEANYLAAVDAVEAARKAGLGEGKV